MAIAMDIIKLLQTELSLESTSALRILGVLYIVYRRATANKPHSVAAAYSATPDDIEIIKT